MVYFDTLAGLSATPKAICRISTDATGDLAVVPEIELDLGLGLTTATVGSAVGLIDIDFVISDVLGHGLLATDRTVYVHVRLDAGTGNLSHSHITWQE